METASQKCYYLKGGIRAIQRDDKVHAGLQVLPRINSKYYRSFSSCLRTFAESDARIYSLISQYLETTAPNWNLFTISGLKVIHMPLRRLKLEKDSINAFLEILHFYISHSLLYRVYRPTNMRTWQNWPQSCCLHCFEDTLILQPEGVNCRAGPEQSELAL